MNDSSLPRIALFADTFDETNGAANFLRRLVVFARQKNHPFLCVRAGNQTSLTADGSVSFLDLKRSPLSIPLDGALRYDPLLWRHRPLVGKTLRDFAPNIVHLTGLNDISQIGFTFAHFRAIPAVATWHTNTHEYAAERLSSVLPSRVVGAAARRKLNKIIERATMAGLMKLYFMAQMQLAPNEELVNEIERLTKRPSFLLGRGVDTDFLSPVKRTRDNNETEIQIGFVGRLRPEKNVRFLANIENALREANIENYKFVIVGEGGERQWLETNLQNVELTGEIFGEELARAYANMDLFVFPSQTDAFGNVVLEAMSSGVPAIVMRAGGPKFLIKPDENGFVADDEADFLRLTVELIKDRQRLKSLRAAARAAAEAHSWERIFEKMFEYYKMGAGFPKNIRADK